MAEILEFPKRVPDEEFKDLLNDPRLIAELAASIGELTIERNDALIGRNEMAIRRNDGLLAVQAMLRAVTNEIDLSKRSPMFVAAVKGLRAWVEKNPL